MARTYGTTWAHLHIGRVRRGLPDVISVKTGAEPVRYERTLILTDVVFNVREAGRQKTIREGVKNVHAWVTGEDGGPNGTRYTQPEGTEWREVKYNPHCALGAFYDAQTGEPVYAARAAFLAGTKVYIAVT